MTSDSLELALPAVPESIGDARAAVTAFLDERDCSPDLIASARLAVTEACSNVVLHAYRSTPGTVELEVWLAAHSVRALVRDHGVGLGVPSSRSQLGLGLTIIERVTEAVEVDELPDGGVEIRMRFEDVEPTRGVAA